jgi:exonuclease VII small subunit
MSKTFNTYQKAAIKNAAKAVARYNATKDKIDEQIAKLEAQKQELDQQISEFVDPIVTLTGGYTPMELCEKVARGNSGQSDWVFKYSDTIVPPESSESQPNSYSGTSYPEGVMPADCIRYPEEVTLNDSGSMLEQEQQNEVGIETITEAAQEADPMNDIF